MLGTLIQILERDDITFEHIKTEIDRIETINYRDTDGLSILHWLVRLRYVPINLLTQIIDYLVTIKKLDINIRNFRLETALIYACRLNREEIVYKLIEKGADIHCWDETYDSALLWSAYNGNLNITKLLIEKGVDIEHKYRDDRIALMWAVRRNKVDIVDYLLNFTTNINQVDKSGLTIFDMCKNEFIEGMLKHWILKNKLNIVVILNRLIQKYPNIMDMNLLSMIFSYYSK